MIQRTVLFACLVLLANMAAADDPPPWGPVHGRALNVAITTITSTATPPAFPPYVEYTVTQRLVLPAPWWTGEPDTVQDFTSLCPADLAPWYCTASAFLGNCIKVSSAFTFADPVTQTSQVVNRTKCQNSHAGDCKATDGILSVNGRLLLEFVTAGSSCLW